MQVSSQSSATQPEAILQWLQKEKLGEAASAAETREVALQERDLAVKEVEKLRNIVKRQRKDLKARMVEVSRAEAERKRMLYELSKKRFYLIDLMVLGFLQIGPSLTLEAKVQINGCFPPPTGGGVAEGFPKMKQHEEYARDEVLSLQRKAAELHAKIIKVKMWTNYTPTPTPTYPKTIDNKNLARKAWTVRVGSQKPNFVNHVDWGSLMPPLKYQGDTNLCWAYLIATCAEALDFIETGERISVDITIMIKSAKDTMSPDDTNLREDGFLAMTKGALYQQGWPPKGNLFAYSS
ncbi:hypothetical protein C1H46_014387 [Malus baccata]|uniref:Uncharacterized protein n=1 Tax=Malus baccata TaxID=106549 RepID=A0A540MMJ7_MALBA|nr:hypothetical protein C1H46_014387 [Malus baccata]